MKIEINTPSIFDPTKIVSGITKSNYHRFSKGFSIFPGNIYDMEEVEYMRNILASNLNTVRNKLVFQKQVHSDEIKIVTKENSNQIDISDGMITNIKGQILNVTVADCVAVLAYDNVNQAIGAFHSGWRGTEKNISKAGIEKMQAHYGTEPKNLSVWLSPSAGAEVYEVGSEVADLFPATVKTKFGDKYLLDVRKRIVEQLLELGVLIENIEQNMECSISNREYHSYRRDKDNSGRMSGFIGMI